MRRKLFILFLFLLCYFRALAGEPLGGTISERGSTSPVVGAVVQLDDGILWAVSDSEGKYTISVPKGQYLLKVSCLGYVTLEYRLTVDRDEYRISDEEGRLYSPDFVLDEESLALEKVVVTASRSRATMGTNHIIGKDALEHLQLTGLGDMAALLPGGKTVNPDLTTANILSLRDGGSSAGNAAFGTALEVDGVRIGTNSALGELNGVDSRSIAVDNIESIEVVTGVPSAEYGDLNSGMVKVNTKKGRSPWSISLSVNPRTYQASLSKGIGLGKDGGVLNLSGEYARSTTKLTSPYTSYTRGNFGATYSNTFLDNLRFEYGATVNVGGMNAKDDPDANNGNTSKARDNSFRTHASLNWMLGLPWISSFKADASLSFADKKEMSHNYCSSASTQPSVHSTEKGYFFAESLPLVYYSDKVVDSKELDFSMSLKYDWTRSFGPVKNRLKAGVQFKSNGNVGQGEYYADPALAPNGFRNRPYWQYPFMHNLSEYLEDNVTIDIGKTRLDIVAGLRLEQVFIRNSEYKDVNSLSPRFNAKWQLGKYFTLRGGWGISEKLPSFNVLYPLQEYLDIQTFAFSSGSDAKYVYHTIPYTMLFNPELKWQRNTNSELAMDFEFNDFRLTLAAYYNITRNPYQTTSLYTPVSFNMMQLPEGYTVPENPQFKVDSQTGEVYMRGSNQEYWLPMELKVQDRSFVKALMQTNGKPVKRAGLELVCAFPEIKPIRTSFTVDAAYGYSSYTDDLLSYYYNNGWKHSSLPNRSYEYVGVYARGTGNSVANGKITHSLDANVTAITHIPQARLVFTFKLEASVLRRSRNLSTYNGEEYAYRVDENGTAATGGSIYEGNSYTMIRPVYYMTLDGELHPFTDAQANDPAFSKLLIKSANAYIFNPDGYGFWCSANFSVTKEIGKHVSLSFYANNFTASRPAVTSMATGVSAVFAPSFYYGLTCRLKF